MPDRTGAVVWRWAHDHLMHLMRMLVVLLLGSPLAAMGCSGTTATKGAPPEAEAPSAGAAPSVPEQPPTPAAPPPSAAPEFWQYLTDLTVFHGYQQGLRWRFGRAGIELEAATIENVSVDDKVIKAVWEAYGAMIDPWSTHYGVPFELIMTAICVESRGIPNARNANNIGLMQILVSPARSAPVGANTAASPECCQYDTKPDGFRLQIGICASTPAPPGV